MEYFAAVLPITAFCGVVGAIVALARGQRRTALYFGIAGFGAIILTVALYYAND